MVPRNFSTSLNVYKNENLVFCISSEISIISYIISSNIIRSKRLYFHLNIFFTIPNIGIDNNNTNNNNNRPLQVSFSFLNQPVSGRLNNATSFLPIFLLEGTLNSKLVAGF